MSAGASLTIVPITGKVKSKTNQSFKNLVHVNWKVLNYRCDTRQ